MTVLEIFLAVEAALNLFLGIIWEHDTALNTFLKFTFYVLAFTSAVLLLQ
jgi:hypothetical protein